MRHLRTDLSRRSVLASLVATTMPPETWAAQQAAPPGDAVAFPLQVSADRRYLVDQHRQPFFIVGDSAQGIYAGLSLPDVASYLAQRRDQGFNAILAEPCHYDGKTVLPSATGQLPFLASASGGRYDGTLGTADFSTPNPAYWGYVDAVLDLAQAHGFLVVQYVVSWGYDASGLWRDLVNFRNTRSLCFAYGRWLGNRYKDRTNILWLDGSDYNGNAWPRLPDASSGIRRSLAVLEGMQAAGAMQLRSGDWKADSLSTDETAFAPFMSVNGVYAYGHKPIQATYTEARIGYLHHPTMPAYLKETGYEESPLVPGDRTSVRKYQFWALLSGATAGLIHGNESIWPFVAGTWQRAVQSAGASDMQRLASLFRGGAWQNLVPSELAGMRRLITSANGSQTPPIANYVAAAQTPDGTLLLAYVPPFQTGPQSLSIDLRGMAGTPQASWWDPTSGTRTAIARINDRGIRDFTTPGENQDGANDWMLLVQS